jgi:hypothetical protein
VFKQLLIAMTTVHAQLTLVTILKDVNMQMLTVMTMMHAPQTIVTLILDV